MTNLRGGRVFISHSADDAAVAGEICAEVERRGIACWLAPRDVRIGDDFLDSIEAAIESAPAFVLVLSRAANDSPFVLSEAEAAFSYKRPIFPVRIEKVELTRSLKMLLSRWHRVDAIGPGREAGIRRVAEAVARRVAGGSGGREAYSAARRPAPAAVAAAEPRWSWPAFGAGPFWFFMRGAVGPGVGAVCAVLAGAVLGAVVVGGPGGAALFLLVGWVAAAILVAIAGPSRAFHGLRSRRGTAAIAASCLATLLLFVGLTVADTLRVAGAPQDGATNKAANGPEDSSRPPAARLDEEAVAAERDEGMRQMVAQEEANAALNALVAQQNAAAASVNTTGAELPTVDGM